MAEAILIPIKDFDPKKERVTGKEERIKAMLTNVERHHQIVKYVLFWSHLLLSYPLLHASPLYWLGHECHLACTLCFTNMNAQQVRSYDNQEKKG